MTAALYMRLHDSRLLGMEPLQTRSYNPLSVCVWALGTWGQLFVPFRSLGVGAEGGGMGTMTRGISRAWEAAKSFTVPNTI